MRVGLFLFFVATAAWAGERQWTLRFNESRSYSSVLIGCLGTASYEYAIPKIELVQEFHAALKSKAAEHKLTGIIWSKTRDPQNAEAILAVDLVTGEVVSVPERGERGLVFCACRFSHLKHCSSSAVPALGEPFTAYSEDL